MCLRANYCHLLARHESCLSSARNCLLLRPTCAHCLPLYIAHSDFTLDPDLPLRAQVMEAVERSQDWSLLRYLP